MGKPGITAAIGYLTDAGFRAARGYPNSPMPHITAMAVAVNVHKAENTAASYAATVCVPREMGPAGCENGAANVAAVWRIWGAACSWGECRFDDDMGVYAVTVYGRWEDPPVTEE